jgi:hypothetical protein
MHLPAVVRQRLVSKVWAKRWLGLCDHWMTHMRRMTLQGALEIAFEHGGVAATVARGLVYRHKEKECRAKRALQAMENGLLRERFIAEHEAALEAMGVPDGYFRYELSLHFQYHSTTRPVDLSEFKARYVHMCTEEQQLHNNNNNSKKKKHQEEEEERSMMMMNDETSFSTASTPKRAYCVMLENMSATLLSSFSKRAKVAGE